MQAIKLVLDRVLPPKRDHAIDVKLPKLQTADDAINAMSLIIDAVGSGNITPSEGECHVQDLRILRIPSFIAKLLIEI
jgi:hypothetical protein